MNILLSIVIVEYKSVDEIDSCVKALKQNISVPYEIIVSSNSCYDKDFIEQLPEIDNVRWVFNERNGGFAYAMNRGLRTAKGKYLAIMNSDCLIHKGFEDMITFMDEHPEVGAIAPQMKDREGNIQDSARPYVTLSRFIMRQTKRLLGRKTSVLNNHMDYTRVQTIDWVIGAFIMVSRKAYESTGGLDDNLFMYAEDLDWCTRIRQNGLEVVYYPLTYITYKGTRRARANISYARIFFKSHCAYWRKYGFFFTYGYPKRRELNFE